MTGSALTQHWTYYSVIPAHQTIINDYFIGTGTYDIVTSASTVNVFDGEGGVDVNVTLVLSCQAQVTARVVYTYDEFLPVELSTFTATFTNQELILRWITQSETNNSHWNVYRSEFEDYSQAYQINGTPVEGQGTISEPTTYVYHDINSSLPETTYWYWLENVDYSRRKLITRTGKRYHSSIR